MKRYKLETEREELFDINMMIVMSVTVTGAATFEEIKNAFRNDRNKYIIQQLIKTRLF